MLVFDLDGTISDPGEGIWRSVNYALEAHGFPAANRSNVAHYIGPPLDLMFRALVAGATDSLVQALVAKYRERYLDIGYAENVAYPGVADALGALAARGTSLGVCTSKRTDAAVRILEHFAFRGHFQFVDGGDIGISKAEQLGRLRAAGTVSVAWTMIGDRAVDIVAARTNGLRAVGVLWGYGSRAELEEATPDALIASPAELVNLV